MNNNRLKEKNAIVTGGGGVLAGSIAHSLLESGVKVFLLDINKEKLDARLKDLEGNGEYKGFVCNVLDENSLRKIKVEILKEEEHIDILVNVAGGNTPGGTLKEDQSVFDMRIEDYKEVSELNLDGTVLPSLIFGEAMVNSKQASIINISSMATYSAISRVMGYSVAKSGVNIFTQWMATELATKFGEHIRVNAIAPGFFIGDQNKAVLINPDGSYTERSKKILARTPMKRFGKIEELNGLVKFLCSDEASFITGTIIPVDGGFSAFSGI